MPQKKKIKAKLVYDFPILNRLLVVAGLLIAWYTTHNPWALLAVVVGAINVQGVIHEGEMTL